MSKSGPHLTERLTPIIIDRKLSKRPGTYCDGRGLYLVVQSPTSRSWLLRYQLNGRSREMGLGPYPETSLARAREKALEARRLIKDEGKDPLTERDAQRAAEKAARHIEALKAVTFEQCADDYLRKHEKEWAPKVKKQWDYQLRNFAFPVLGPLPVYQIDTPLVLKVLEPIWNTKTATASKLRSRIEAILSAATVAGHREGDNVASWSRLKHLLPSPQKIAKTKHQPSLDYRLVPDFMRKLVADKSTEARALELQILTACRPGEINGLEWQDVQFDNHLMVIPASRMKTRKEHRVALSDRAIELLESIHGERKSGLVFSTARGARIQWKSFHDLLKRFGFNSGEATAHGFRSSFSTWAAETGREHDAVELQLSHTVGSAVERAYRRTDRFADRCRLMQAWAEWCEGKAVAKVVELHKAG